MLHPPVLPDEDARLETLLGYEVLDTPAETEFDELGALAGQICGAPIALVTFMERERQWFKAKVGVEISENQRALSFCAHTLSRDQLFVIPDTLAAPDFADHPLVTGEPHIRFYAGSPLVAPDGQIIGTLCVLDVVPHELAPWQREALRTLSRQVMAQLELRLQRAQERKRAAEALQSAQKRLENIAANVPGLVFQLKMYPDGRQEFPFLGEGCRELCGVEAARLTANPDLVAQMIHPQDRPGYLHSVEVSARERTLWNWQGRIVLPDGQVKWLEGASRPHGQDDGAVVWDGLMLDVTDRVEAQSERDRFFNLPLCMLAVAGQDGYFKRLNRTFESVLGWSEAELLAVPFIERVHPDDRKMVRGVMKKLAAGAPLVTVVNRFQNARGGYLDLQWTSAPHGDLIYTVAHDVTSLREAQGALSRANDELENRIAHRTEQLQGSLEEQRKSEARLAASARRVQRVLESISDAFVSFDKKWRYTYVNEEAERLLGRARDELLGRDLWECSPEIRGSALESQWRQAAQSGQPATLETFYPPLNCWIEAHIYPSDEGLSVYFQDITARHQNQAALEQARYAADAANRAKSEFLSQMSHELRTPLNSILGFAQILEMQELDELQRESVGYILKSGQHLLDLIDEILDMTQVEAAQSDLPIEPVALPALVDEACALMRPLADEREIAIEIEAWPAQWAVRANAQRLKQVVLNLLSNAIKYNRDGGRVELSGAASTNGRVRLSVRDTGVGISLEDIAHLFQPFERGAAANTPVPGTGLGLALSRRLVEAMGGTLTVASAPGEGSTFTIELTQVPAPLEKRAPTATSVPED